MNEKYCTKCGHVLHEPQLAPTERELCASCADYELDTPHEHCAICDQPLGSDPFDTDELCGPCHTGEAWKSSVAR